MDRLRCACLLLSLFLISGAGCCCVQGVSSHGDCGLGTACGPSSCGPCGPGPLASLISCRGACGDVYVDEWVSEPPQVDPCGYDCGGCGRCGTCRPLRSVLRLLWGTPYIAECSTGLCGPSCDAGCSTCDSAMGYDNHVSGEIISNGPMRLTPQANPNSTVPPAPSETMEGTSEEVPTPAPAINNSSAKRLNPAQRRAVRHVSASR